MKKTIALLLLTTAWIACDRTTVEQQTLDLDTFSLQAPASWTYIQQQGVDSYVGLIRLDDQDTIGFDYGWYSNALEVDPATHDIHLMTIDGKRAKVVQPKTPGQGTTGVYFDSLETTRTNKFQLSGQDLTAENQQLLLSAIETLKFAEEE